MGMVLVLFMFWVGNGIKLNMFVFCVVSGR